MIPSYTRIISSSAHFASDGHKALRLLDDVAVADSGDHLTGKSRSCIPVDPVHLTQLIPA